MSIVDTAVAVTPVPDNGPLIVMIGGTAYPRPLSVIVISETVVPPIEHVAAAPVPPPPLIVIVGGTVYPAPALVNSNLKIDCTFTILVVIATAVAFVPPAGAVEIATVGVLVYPLPSLFKNISLIAPLAIVAVAVAVIADPTRVSDVDISFIFYSIINFINCSINKLIFIFIKFATQFISIT